MTGTMVTTASHHGYHKGDRVDISGYPNRFRHWVGAVTSVHTFELGQHIRASKGFRRHVRRQKAAGYLRHR